MRSIIVISRIVRSAAPTFRLDYVPASGVTTLLLDLIDVGFVHLMLFSVFWGKLRVRTPVYITLPLAAAVPLLQCSEIDVAFSSIPTGRSHQHGIAWIFRMHCRVSILLSYRLRML